MTRFSAAAAISIFLMFLTPFPADAQSGQESASPGRITADNTVFLDIDVENTTPDFSKVNGSQLNPVLNTAQSTTQVLISDGGTVVIGGVIATSNQLAISQVPLLGSIPILGHMFRHTLVNTQTQELIFFITPKIVQT